MTDQTENSKHDALSSEKSWPERNVNFIIFGLVVACVATIIAQLLCGPVLKPLFDDHHPAHFELEKLIGFHAVFGFAAFVVIVFLGRILRLFVMRKEDYYDS